MDHLILPEGSKAWIKVAYDCKPTYYYENFKGDFFKFPERYNYPPRPEGWTGPPGWTYDEILAQPKSNENLLGGVIEDEIDAERTPSEIESFFQTWLFFGLLIELFGVCGIPVTTDRFLVPFTLKTRSKPQTAHLITTAELPSLIMQWKQRRGSSDNLRKIIQILDYVGKVIDHHCANGKDHRSINQYGTVLWPLKDEITTSIIAVAATLRKAARNIYEVTGKEERWPVTNSRILHERIRRKWCRSDAAMIMEDFDIDGQYYIAAAPSHSLESLDDHSACTDYSCEAKISDGTYVTKHADDCQSHNDYDPEPTFLGHQAPQYPTVARDPSRPFKEPKSVGDAVKNILDEGHLPVLRWDNDRQGLETYGHEKHQYSEDESAVPPYVAISHVWADGMGNPFDNSLPYCQLQRIQTLVDNLCANHLPQEKTHTKPGFWMDTLCCIVGLDDESRAYKSKSIKSMREIYQECVAVLIIDPWLTSISSTSPVSEISHRVYASGWSRRLWTHQEGFLGRDVYYQLQDKPVSLSKISDMAREYQKRMAAKGFMITFPVAASSKTSFYYTGIKSIIENIREGRFSKDDRWIVYRHLAESLAHRSTTNIDDELLCVASVIGLNVSDYAKHNEKGNKQKTAELRMQAFLEELGRFHQGIIFNNYRRLTTPGFRWAPVSLLGHRSSGLGDVEGSKDSRIEDFSHLPMEDKHVELESLGIKINLTRYVAKTMGINKRYVSMVVNNKKVKLPTVGLPVDFPGYTIKFPKDSGLTINMAERRFVLKYSSVQRTVAVFTAPPLPIKTPSFGKVPKVGGLGGLRGIGKAPEPVVRQVESAPVVENVVETTVFRYVVFVAENDVKWEYDRNYAIILQKPLGDKDNTQFLAMIGLNSIGPGPRTFVQSLCSAVVRMVKDNESPKITAGLDVVEVFKPKTNWVVT